MKSCKILLGCFVLFFVVGSECLYAKEAEKTMDFATAIANAGTDSNGKVTVATIKALMAKAAEVGAKAEVAMTQALMKAYPNQALTIASTTLNCCSEAAVVGVFTVALANTHPASWDRLQAVATKAHPKIAQKINATLAAKANGKGGIVAKRAKANGKGGSAGNRSSGRNPSGIQGFITSGAGAERSENPASP